MGDGEDDTIYVSSVDVIGGDAPGVPIEVPCFLHITNSFPTCDIAALPRNEIIAAVTSRIALHVPSAATGGFPIAFSLPPFDAGVAYSAAGGGVAENDDTLKPRDRSI